METPHPFLLPCPMHPFHVYQDLLQQNQTRGKVHWDLQVTASPSEARAITWVCEWQLKGGGSPVGLSPRPVGCELRQHWVLTFTYPPADIDGSPITPHVCNGLPALPNEP